MASPEELRIEQKIRSLKLKEDALSRQAEQQARTENRIKNHQVDLAQKERANQLKAKDLIDRELKYKEEQGLLTKNRKDLLDTQQNLDNARHRQLVFIIPFLLIACTIAGYFAYEQLNEKEQHFEQVTHASQNIDKLAKLLSNTQSKAIEASNALHSKQIELERTKSMLSDLKNTSEQLQIEILDLKENQNTSSSEKSSLLVSVHTLSDQLEILQTQLEDKYLTIDINEAYIDTQEVDLNIVKEVLSSKLDTIEQKNKVLSEQQHEQVNLKHSLQEKEQVLSKQAQQVAVLNSDLQSIKQELKKSKSNIANLEKKNAKLTIENTRLKITPTKQLNTL